MRAWLGRHPLLGIFLLALMLRVPLAIAVQRHVDRAGREFLISGDADGYWRLAGKLANGEDYAIYTPPRYVLRMPGFPLLLAGVRTIGGGIWEARLMLAALGAAGCSLTAALGHRLVGQTAGSLAGVYTALSPSLAGISVLLLSESTFAVAMLLNLWCFVRWLQASEQGPARSHQLVWAGLCGITFALACYVRPGWLLALPAALVFQLARSARRWRAVVKTTVCVACAALSLFPWAYRNHQVTGHWVVTTLWSGPSLYDGLNPHADGGSDMRFFDEERLLTRMSEYEMNRHYTTEAWRFVKEHPGRAVELAARKQLRYWTPWPNAAEVASPFIRIAVGLTYLPLVLGAAWGAWRFRREGLVMFIAVGPLLYFAGVHCVFVGSMRYRLPTEFPLSLLAAAGLWELWRRRFESRQEDAPCSAA